MRYVSRLGINIEAMLKLVAMLGFALFFYTVIEAGNVQYYVHPRIIPYMKFGIAAFVLISLFMSDELFKPKRGNVRVARYLLFIVPLICAFALPPKIMDYDSMSLSSINTAGNEVILDEGSDNNVSEQKVSGIGDNTSKSNKGLLLQGDTIIMEDSSFVPWIQELYDNFGKYEDKKIQVVGFVFKDKEFKQDEFVTARYMMNCCAADMQLVGILCNYQGAELKKDSWVKVSGKIQMGQFDGQKMPVIAVENVVPEDKPKNEFVYPY